jgi:glycosyltransferase involved in cell wall biosynthesis
MKILIIGPFPDPIFGVSLSNSVLYNGLKQARVKVTKIDTAVRGSIDSKVGGWNLNKLAVIKSYFKLYKVFGSDVIYCTSGQTFFGILKYAPFVWLAALLRKPAVVHIKGGFLRTSYENMSPLKKKISKSVLAKYRTGIVLSKSLKPLLEGFIPEKRIFIQHNFIQDALLQPSEKILSKKNFKALNIIYLSNLMITKGIEDLLDALEILSQQGVTFEAKIAGNIPKGHNYLLTRMNQLPGVSYLGVVKNVKKSDLLSWGNVFCLPTYYDMEGQPISILEAMGFGNLIVTTAHAGIPDICNQDNSAFVHKKDPKDIARVLIELSKMPDRVEAICRHNLKQAQERYTEEAFISGIESILKQTTNC